MVTGKNKEQFEKWFTDNYDSEFMPDDKFSRYIWFIKQPFEMQIGVYLAYYDSFGYFIEIKMLESSKDWIYQIWGIDIMSPLFKMAEMDVIEIPESRNEAYQEAFKKADELINQINKH